jgi:hypothetical protein
MKSSSRSNPCPICLRNTDDKCRWNSESILCYSGDKFRPGNNLKRGDKVKALGSDWILISFNAGFSGASYLFVLDDGRFKKLSPEERSRFNRSKIATSRRAIFAFREIEQRFFLFFAPKDFTVMNSEELIYAEKFSAALIQSCEKLDDYMSLNRTSLRPLGAMKLRLKQMRELLKALQGDLLHFRQEFLGESVQPPSSGR